MLGHQQSLGINFIPTSVSLAWLSSLPRDNNLFFCLDFHNTSITALWATMPTQLALLFFNVLHPPLNVPALGTRH